MIVAIELARRTHGRKEMDAACCCFAFAFLLARYPHALPISDQNVMLYNHLKLETCREICQVHVRYRHMVLRGTLYTKDALDKTKSGGIQVLVSFTKEKSRSRDSGSSGCFSTASDAGCCDRRHEERQVCDCSRHDCL